MGIEPFLLVLIVVAMFLVQAGRALFERLQDRIDFSSATLLGVQAFAKRQRLLVDRRSGGWLTGHDGLDVQLWFDAFPAREIREVMRREVGVRPVRVRRHLGWLAPSVLVVVRLPRPLARRLRVSALPGLVPDSARVPLHNPVLDQLVRVSSTDAGRARELLTPPEVHQPLLEMLGTHPLSVVTESAVALWCAQPVADPEPLIALAAEIAQGLRDVGQVPEAAAAQGSSAR